MFDLFRNREKTKKYMMGGILVMVSASMLLYLVPNYNTGSGASDVVLAKIGGDEITEVEARDLIRKQTTGRQIPAEIIPNYVPRMIDGMLVDRALEYEAHKLGFTVSDEDVADYLRGNIPSLFQDGKFVGKAAYAQMLAQQGTTIDAFETDLKRQMLINEVRKIAMEGVVVTPAEIEQEYRKKNEQIQLQYVKIPSDKYKKEAEPSAADLQTYYTTNFGAFRIPETRNLTILVADGAKMEASLNLSDAELLAAYNQNIANFRMPERVHVRHILLMTKGKPASEDTKMKAKAEDLVKQLRAGADFAELAKKNSDDNQGPSGGSAAKGGDLDWVTKGQMVAEFEKATFSLKPMAISDPVKTEYGYHIIQVLAHEDARVKPLAEVKDDLIKNYKQQRVSNMLQQVSDKVQAALQKNADHPDDVARQFGMDVVHADNVKPGATIPEVGPSSDFEQSIATLKKGEVSQAVSPAANKVVVAEVTGITPARAATFDEVKNQIHDTVVNTRAASLLQKHSKELVDAAKANGGDLAKAAKAMGLEVKTSALFKRQGDIEGFGSAGYVDSNFSDPVNTVFGPIAMSDGAAIAKISNRVAADMSKLPEERDKLLESLKGEKARDRGTAFETGLVEELTRKGVIKMHPEVITRIISSFRGGS